MEYPKGAWRGMNEERCTERRRWRSPKAKLPDSTVLHGAGPALAWNSERKNWLPFRPSHPVRKALSVLDMDLNMLLVG